MAIWVIMPYSAARKIGGEEFASRLRSAYESFGIAWRLLDDIRDLETDMARGVHSAVYASLDDKGRRLWDSIEIESGEESINVSVDTCAIIQSESLLRHIAKRIISELGQAATLSADLGLDGFADDLRILAGPVVEWLKRG